ncbi:Atrial natriuretic peptide receptor 1 [Hypsibius exemplaris]|uniref:guanylate cyclase n=1 Tax=Hypsibius exemplaris TaxID=2072580 RepID=A0A1W0WMX7_HYPEX|nr:Atrial natriuretic peptide receptor 1 [Hypsibius exemplaris]
MHEPEDNLGVTVYGEGSSPNEVTCRLTIGSAFPEAHHNSLYPTAVSFSPLNFAVWAKTFVDIFKHFQWSSISVLYDSGGRNSFYSQLADNLRNYLVPADYPKLSLQFFEVDSGVGITEERRQGLLKLTNLTSRIIILAFRANDTRRFMVSAAALDMTKPEYVAKEAFRTSLFQLTGSCSTQRAPGLAGLYQRIEERSRMEYGVRYADNQEPSEIALASYFSVKTLGIVINAVLTSDPSQSRNGTVLAKQFSNNAINPSWMLDNQTGINIDSSGDRAMDICVQRYNVEADTFSRTVMYYDSALAHLTPDFGPIDWRTPGNAPAKNVPVCGYDGAAPNCAPQAALLTVPQISGVSVGIALFCTLLGLFATWKVRKEFALKDEWWKMSKDAIAATETAQHHPWLSSHPSRVTKNSAFSLSTMGKDPKHIRRMKGVAVWVTKVQIVRSFTPTRNKKITLREMKMIAHGNLVHLVGIVVEPSCLQFVYEFCSKGSLDHLLNKMNIDWEFRAALLSDLLEGVSTLHASVLRRHGYLNPYTCLVDKRFTLKIAECGLYDLTSDILPPPGQEESQTATLTFSNAIRWIPPEIKKLGRKWSNLREIAGVAGPEADIYAVGGIMSSVMEEQDDVMLRSEGSSMSLAKPMDLERIIAACQYSNPNSRPGIEELKKAFYHNTGVRTGGFLESLVRRMQKYALKLEYAVKDRTEALNIERRLCEKLLVEMLPKPIVEMLLSGCAIEPEHFHGVTIFFSVIVGFVEFVASQTPLGVIDFLNHVFSSFDDVLPTYDVYKVEVVSGLPTPNGDLHAVEICRMSLHLLAVFRRIADDLEMQIQIGLHSGSCAAGVVGSKRPRYCLFGDTVNTASRLASHGKPSRIHMSATTCSLVVDQPDFLTVERGVIELKGKGKERTFWLEGG